MTKFQQKALHGGLIPQSTYIGAFKILLSVLPSDKRPSGFIWMASVAGFGSEDEKKKALLQAMEGAGDVATDYHTKNPSGATYLMRDLTADEIQLRAKHRS